MEKRLLLILFLAGCNLEPFSIDKYIAETCDEKGDYIFYIDYEFTTEQMEVIATATDDASDDLGVDIQICGVVEEMDFDFIEYGYTDHKSRVGFHHNGVITIYPTCLIHGYDHFRKIYLHELGHYFGVDHSLNDNNIMMTGWHGVSDYSKNDIRRIKEAIK